MTVIQPSAANAVRVLRQAQHARNPSVNLIAASFILRLSKGEPKVFRQTVRWRFYSCERSGLQVLAGPLGSS